VSVLAGVTLGSSTSFGVSVANRGENVLMLDDVADFGVGQERLPRRHGRAEDACLIV
jgi:hypothetical protein